MKKKEAQKKSKKYKKFKKLKKAPEYAPVFVNVQEAQSQSTFILRIMVKVFLVCLAASGFCVVFAQIYRLPVNLSDVVFICFASVIIFNTILFFFKKSIFIIPLIIVLIFAVYKAVEIIGAFIHFINHFLHILDSRLLSTARFAVYEVKELDADYIAAVFFAVCILLSLVFTLASRSRFIGIILVLIVFLLTPAFGAEIAGYVSGMVILAAGMLGLYAMWVAHAWENHKGNLRLEPPSADSDKPDKSEKPASEPPHGIPFKIINPKRMPHFYKYSINSIIASFLAVVAVFTATTAVPSAIKFDYKVITSAFSGINIRMPEALRGFFKRSFGKINDNGFFPDIDSGSDISAGITMDAPPTGSIPIIRVTLEDDSDKIYFRGGIGIDFTEYEWTIQQNSPEFKRLNELLKGFTPDDELKAFLSEISLYDDYMPYTIGRQEVKIEYMARTGFLLLPTNPYDNSFKSNPNYSWYSDTCIRPKGKVSSTVFDTLYPIPSEDGYTSYFLRDVDGYEGVDEYRDLINSVYMNVPESESDNIDRLLYEIGFLDVVAYQYGGMSDYADSRFLSFYSSRYPEDYYYVTQPEETTLELDSFRAAQFVNDYLRENYTYSLTADNTQGDNTVIGNFLYETGRGHCAMYASAMTLAMRRLGLPARYVTGIVTIPGDGRVQEMAERDFHAWTEVYFEGVGWLPFDPTGGAFGLDGGNSELSGGTQEGEAPEPADETGEHTQPDFSESPPPDEATAPPFETRRDPAQETATNPEYKDKDKDDDENEPPLIAPRSLIIIILVVLAAGSLPVIIVFALRRLNQTESAKLAAFRDSNSNQAAQEMYRFMFKLLKAEGLRVLTGEAPLAFGRRIDEELPLEKSLDSVMPVFEKLEFSGITLTREEYRAIYEYITALYKQVVTDKKMPLRLIRRIQILY